MSVALQSVSVLAEASLLEGRVIDKADTAIDAPRAVAHSSPEIERAAQIVSGKDGLYVASYHVDNFTNPLVAQVGPARKG